ncbi:flagellar basal body rod protein FlgC [Stratiformator vulcanicus]|uniref:Flagellar basal-body rod protein FlgC n=1 Tax=Stratiformator vulcanicus TaxID=2527980 RepID=A0A517R5F6_9PLAN|nr:flagellar basal body rod protein FlgC [Stratiformator vulcanicus]QDT39063.1 Flagellar basal-body rod protein FlgC [Stratiformator vulcanicus]
MLRSIDVSTSALVAQRQRMNTISANIANAETTRDADGNKTAYQRRYVAFEAAGRPDDPGGTAVNYRVNIDDSNPVRKVLEPGHPDADAEGYVSYPNINLVTEFVNAVEAARAYEANVVAIEMSKQMAQTGLRIIA